MDRTAWSAYQSQYRGYAEPETATADVQAMRVFSA
jgi:hypothetical protein